MSPIRLLVVVLGLSFAAAAVAQGMWVTLGDKIYVIGGATVLPGASAVHPQQPHSSVGAVEEYDPATNSWRSRAPLPTPRNHAVGAAVNGKIYVIGGRVGGAFVSSGSS